MPGLKSTATVLKFGERMISASFKNSKKIVYASAAGWAAMKINKGEGVLDPVIEGALGKDVKDKYQREGLAGGVNRLLFGQDGEDKSFIENVTDGVAGEGAYDTMRSAASNAVEKGQEAIQSVVSAGTRATDLSSTENVLYDANGNPHVMPQPVTPSLQMQQIQQSSPFSSVGDFVSGLTGGKVSVLNMLEIIAAAYMMFGSRFGWIGKIGGALIGGAAAKDITNRAAQIQYQQQSSQMNQGIFYQPGYNQTPSQVEDENYTVSRSRRL